MGLITNKPPEANLSIGIYMSRKLTWKKAKTTMNEDVSPIKNGDFPLSKNIGLH